MKWVLIAISIIVIAAVANQYMGGASSAATNFVKTCQPKHKF